MQLKTYLGHARPFQVLRPLQVWLICLWVASTCRLPLLYSQTFTPIDLPIPVASGGVAQWGDYDGDGKYDFLITGQPDLHIYHNDGNASFSEQGLSVKMSGSPAAIWADWNGDNRPDLIVGGADSGGGPVQGVYALTRIYRNDGTNFTLVGDGIPFVGSPTLCDLDRDGHPDLVIAGSSLRLYLNDGDGSFHLHLDLPLPSNTFVVRVVDVNRDGFPDLVHLHLVDGGAFVTTRINDGRGQFDSNSVFYPLGPGTAVFADVDNDGREDLGVIAYNNGPLPSYSGWLRNEPATNTLLPGINFPLINPSWSAADYDNDGRIDFAGVGADAFWVNRFRLFHNNGGFSFSQVDPGIEGTQFAVMAWGDFDLDGDLDLLLSGIPNPPAAGSPFVRLYRNDSLIHNSPPSTPTDLTAQVQGSGVRLSWSAATDPNQSGGLTYNARVGHQSSGVDVISPAADLATGRLLLPQPGNSGLLTFAVLTNLLAGRYYWSVQSVDLGFASSAFAGEQSFDIPPGLPRAAAAVASDLHYQHATLTGLAVANGTDSLAWFEYGLSTNYDSSTLPTAIGSGVTPVVVSNDVSGLLTATPYHFRLVASNSVGLAFSPDTAFFISNTPPVISGLTNLVIMFPNRPSPLLSFAVGDLEAPAVSLQTIGSAANTNLLPQSGIEFGGSDSNRTLRLTPAAEQRGITSLSVSVLDEHGGQAAKFLTVRVEDFTPVWSPARGSGQPAVADVNRDGLLDVIWNDKWYQNSGGTNLVQPVGWSIDNPLSGSLAVADIDGDGDLDLIESGSRLTTRLTLIWTNAAPTTLPVWFHSASVPGLQGYFNSAISWADFDQDGATDLLLVGNTNTPNTSNFLTCAYRNDRSGRFTLLPGLFPNLANPAFAWADFDRDGDLDLCATGTTNAQLARFFTGLFMNDGQGQFTLAPVSLPAISTGLALAGDFDNDGWPDLLLAGKIIVGNSPTNVTKLFRNGGDGTFSEYAELAPLIAPRGVLADFDGDGKLDIALLGSSLNGIDPPILKVYLNRGNGQFFEISPTLPYPYDSPSTIAAGDIDRDGRIDLLLGGSVFRNNFPSTNTPPETPPALHSTTELDAVTLSWSEALDANQSAGLTYNLRVGTAPGLVNVMSPLAEPLSGTRWVPLPGNASQSLHWRLRGLSPGTYFWSVQAIDYNFTGSPFAPEQSFTIVDSRPHFLTATLTNNGIAVQVQFGVAGSFSLLTSSDLQTWNESPPADYPAGQTNLFFPNALVPSQFFRLRKN